MLKNTFQFCHHIYCSECYSVRSSVSANRVEFEINSREEFMSLAEREEEEEEGMEKLNETLSLIQICE